RREAGEGVWTEEPGLRMRALGADCVPIAIAARGRGRLTVLHAGWRGLLGGLVAAGASAVRRDDDELAAVIGPSAGPCCYEVGGDVAGLFDADLTHEGRLDPWAATERLLRAAGVCHREPG